MNAVDLKTSVLERLDGGGALRSAVVGAGASGFAAAELLFAKGAEVTVLDDCAVALDALPPHLGRGPLTKAAVDGAELVVLSPGVPRANPQLRTSILGGRLVGEVELASWFIQCPTLGITGTNGKSTTTALLGHLLRQAEGRCFVGGNLGEPPSLLALRPEGVRLAVLELSSYQLESISTLRFAGSAWLNLQPDHLDRYPSYEAYAETKARLYAHTDGPKVVSMDDPVVRAAGERSGGDLRYFSTRGPLEPGMSGVWVEDGVAFRGEERYELDGPGLLGVHNHENAAAAIELARSFGVTQSQVQAGLSTYRPLPHRLELVCFEDGVRWYDDSKATNVASAVTSARAMSTAYVLVVGGVDKGGSWAPLVEAAEPLARRVLGIGAASEVAEAAFAGKVPFEACGTLEAAVERARALTEPGQAVLLAPACASFDQFTSYAHRGRAFARLARQEPQE